MKLLTAKIIAIIAVPVVAAAIYVLATGTTLQPRSASAAAQMPVDESTITAIYATYSPAVVEIKVTSQTPGIRGGGFMQSGQGSGFVIDATGNILTNNHVVDGATTVQVVFKDGKTANATVVGTDPVDDLALVKVDASVLEGGPLTLADSSAIKPGQLAIALGSPYGLTNSITVGVVSGLNRNIGGMTGMIQTDANINPGNSGGPLLNSNGQVIGINTAVEAAGSGIGFAVPSNVATKALADLKAGKQIARPWIGITGLDMTQAQAQTLGLTVNQGVYVVTVASGSPGEKAGLKGSGTDSTGAVAKGGDLIAAIDGKAMTATANIQDYLTTKKAGDVVTLTILRGGANTSVAVTLAARPADTTTITPNPAPRQQPLPTTPWPWGGRGGQRVPSN